MNGSALLPPHSFGPRSADVATTVGRAAAMPMRFQHSPAESLARQHPVSAPDAYSKIPQDLGQAHEISELARLKVWLSMCICLSRGLRNALDSGGALACKLRKLRVVDSLFS